MRSSHIAISSERQVIPLTRSVWRNLINLLLPACVASSERVKLTWAASLSAGRMTQSPSWICTNTGDSPSQFQLLKQASCAGPNGPIVAGRSSAPMVMTILPNSVRAPDVTHASTQGLGCLKLRSNHLLQITPYFEGLHI